MTRRGPLGERGWVVHCRLVVFPLPGAGGCPQGGRPAPTAGGRRPSLCPYRPRPPTAPRQTPRGNVHAPPPACSPHIRPSLCPPEQPAAAAPPTPVASPSPNPLPPVGAPKRHAPLPHLPSASAPHQSSPPPEPRTCTARRRGKEGEGGGRGGGGEEVGAGRPLHPRAQRPRGGARALAPAPAMDRARYPPSGWHGEHGQGGHRTPRAVPPPSPLRRPGSRRRWRRRPTRPASR